MKAKVNSVNIQVIQDNIHILPVDAIVVETDPNLSVSDILLQFAGETIQQQTRQIGWADIGEAVITDAGKLPNTQKIIHAVSPRWGEGSERGKLSNVTWGCLSLAESHLLKSIALPALSVGVWGYPVEACANIMITRIIDFTFEKLKSLRSVVLCLDNTSAFDVFRSEFERQILELRETGEGKVRV